MESLFESESLFVSEELEEKVGGDFGNDFGNDFDNVEL